MKVYVSTKLYMHVIEAIFEISKTLIRNINCSEIDEWIKTSWYIYTKEYYSAIERMNY